MRYASLFSGVGTDHLALAPLGWECAWFSEIDPFACAVLQHRFPSVPNLGDVTGITDEEIARHGPIDLLVGGSPCQGFSVAGRGKGLDDPRSGLARHFVRLVSRIAPRWVVFENVGGIRNSRHAADFQAFIGAFREIGYLGCVRSLDARYFGVPQRRDRVFAVFHPRDWRPPAAVLFEPDCVRRDTPKGRETGTRVASAVTRGLGSGGADDVAHALRGQSNSTHREDSDNFIVGTFQRSHGNTRLDGPMTIVEPPPLAKSLNARNRQDHETETLVAHTLRAGGFDASEDGSGRGKPLVVEDDPGVYCCVHDARHDPPSCCDIPGCDCGGATRGPVREFYIPDLSDPIQANEQRTWANAGNNAGKPHNVIAYDPRQITSGENRSNPQAGDPRHALHATPPAVAFSLRGREGGSVPEMDDVASVRAASGGASRSFVVGPEIAATVDETTRCPKDAATYVGVDLQNAALRAPGEAGTLCSKGQSSGNRAESVMPGLTVRRLTPLECEKLQGYPPYWTWVPYPRPKPKAKLTRLAKDAPRYKAIGNGIALPCLVWIARRLTAVDEILRNPEIQRRDA